MRKGLGWLLLLASIAWGQWNAPQVGTFAVATLRDDAVASRLRARFKAIGPPLFLLGRPLSGLQQGDIIRFGDKVVLVDADVWQTLAAEGALRALRHAPVFRVAAGSDPAAWTNRSKLDPDRREKKLYEIGAALLKTLRATVGVPPEGQNIHLGFENGEMVLMAPANFLESIRTVGVDVAPPKEKSIPRGRPRWVNRPSKDTFELGESLEWTGWAVDDSGGATNSYRYSQWGPIPAGLVWDPVRRRLNGVWKTTGSWHLSFVVWDGKGGADTLDWRPVAIHRPALEPMPDTTVPAPPIRKLDPPRFVSRSGGSHVPLGTTRTYRPIAVDGNGRLIPKVEASIPDGGPLTWDGTELRVAPVAVGAWSARFVARDSAGDSTEHWTTFLAEPTSHKDLTTWTWETHRVGGAMPSILTGEFGHGRVSFLIPEPSHFTSWDDRSRLRAPMLLLGVEFLDPASVRRGNAVTLDLGGALRLPDPSLLAGGVGGRLRVRSDARPALPWVFEGDVIGYVQQAIIAIDTSRIRADILPEGSDTGLQVVVNHYRPLASQLLHDAFDPRNAVFLSRVEGWLQLPVGFQAGVGFCRIDLPVRMNMNQYVSGGLRWAHQGRWGNIELTQRWGMGTGGVQLASWTQVGLSVVILP